MDSGRQTIDGGRETAKSPPESPISSLQSLISNSLLAIVGPTAIGKTDLSLYLAQRMDGEIISADSRLFYRGMDIGTAKPSLAERAVVPHHLVDIADPDQTITLGQYQDAAYAAVDTVHRRGRLPILVGGTGQYVMAVVEGWGIPRVAPRPALRRALHRVGGPDLHRWLSRVDPEAADAIHPNNVRRVIRALEVTLVSGLPMSDLQRKSPPPYDILMVGLRTDRDTLYARIDRRVERMMEEGLLEELRQLRDEGYESNLPAMSGLGYRQLWDHLEGDISRSDAVERIKSETHRFVRHQHNWFSPDDKRINWFDATRDDVHHAVERFVRSWLHVDEV